MSIRRIIGGVALSLLVAQACAAGPALSPAERAAAFKAAGFKALGRDWVDCGRGQISEVRDINGDGLPEVLISERDVGCFGNAGQGYSLVSQQANGDWHLLAQGTGMPGFLPGPGVGGWPDMLVGGPGFCFPVYRWNGRKYELNRREYEGKPCSP